MILAPHMQRTAFYNASEHTPGRPGPYECEMLFPHDSDKTAKDVHYRWFDGQYWSHPLDYDPDLDTVIEKPEDHMFVKEAESIAAVLGNFQWCGLTDNPNPEVDHRTPEQLRLDNGIRGDLDDDARRQVEDIEQERIAAGPSPMDVQWEDENEL